MFRQRGGLQDAPPLNDRPVNRRRGALMDLGTAPNVHRQRCGADLKSGQHPTLLRELLGNYQRKAMRADELPFSKQNRPWLTGDCIEAMNQAYMDWILKLEPEEREA